MQGETGKTPDPKSPEEKGQNGNENNKKQVEEAGDVEARKIAAGPLHPGMAEDPKLRWAFVRKVYLILAVQFLVTVAIAVTFNRVRPIPDFILSSSRASLALFVVVLILPFFALFPMLYFRTRHPLNMVFLGLFTLCISLTVSWVAATLKGMFLLEAAFVTMIVLFGLSLYTFWAARRCHDFKFLAPFLLVSTLVLLVYLIIQICHPFQGTTLSIYGCIATITYSGFIIYDTNNLIKRHKYEEYTHAAVSLYLDVINLFLSVLAIPAFNLQPSTSLTLS